MIGFPREHEPTRRGHDEESSEALHTDVMRFVAVLALCLAAILALVRDLPPQVTPAKPIAVTPAPEEPRPAMDGGPHTEGAKAALVEDTTGSVAAVNRGQGAAVAPPAAKTNRELPTPAPVAPARTAPTPRAESGFSLRFASDEALQAMVARGRIRVYARTANGKWWVTERSRAPYFRPAAAPIQLHTMATATVSAAMKAAFVQAAGGEETRSVRWGVTLPIDVQARVANIIERHRGGRLVISATGRVAFEAVASVDADD